MGKADISPWPGLSVFCSELEHLNAPLILSGNMTLAREIEARHRRSLEVKMDF
jgi:hypothetical protein